MKMSKNLLLGGALASALILGACSANASADNLEWETEETTGVTNVREQTEVVSDTTAQEAVDKALEEFEGTITDVEYDEDDGIYYYEIEIKNGTEEFDVKINADDLSVIERDLDVDGDRDDDRDDQNEDESATVTKEEPKENKEAKETDSDNSSLDNAFGGIKASEAIAVAQEKFDGILEEISYEEDDGIFYYEVKLENATEEYEVKLRANDLTVLEEELEGDNNERSFRKLEAAHQEKIITFEEAVKIAEEAVNGEVKEWSYDVDDFKFDFEIDVNDDDNEVEVNAKTGDVVEIDD